MFQKFKLRMDPTGEDFKGISKKRFSSREKAAEIAREVFEIHREAEEVFIMICLDIKMNPVAGFEVSRGAINYTVTTPREIMKRAVLANAAGIILIHNHPSGDTTPSSEDIKFSKRVKEAGAIIGIPLIDSLIISHKWYDSLIDAETNEIVEFVG